MFMLHNQWVDKPVVHVSSNVQSKMPSTNTIGVELVINCYLNTCVYHTAIEGFNCCLCHL